jgi:hypothetical protein
MHIAKPAALAEGQRALVALILVLLTVIGGVLVGVSSARADVPDPSASEPFNAPLCEGTTIYDPTQGDEEAGIPDMTLVWGQRLIDYNNGQVVILHGASGRNNGTPACTVRYVDGVGPVSEWAYCTDHDSYPCTITNADGELTAGAGLQHLDSNGRLSLEQERLIAYIVRHDMPVVGPSGNVASNADPFTRTSRQALVWCVSDPEEVFLEGFCEANMNTAEQQRLLALVPAETELSFDLRAEDVDLEVGDTARVDVTTNVYGQPIALAIDGGLATVCEGDASLSGGVLTVHGLDAAISTTITLCITTDEAGTVTVSGSATSASREQISWVQSPGSEGMICQVFATFETTRAATITGSAAVQFRAVPAAVGGFSVAKVVEGTASNVVPDDTVFTVEYIVGDGVAQELSVAADGTPVSVGGLTEGDVVTLTEVDLPTIAGVTWGAPVFEVDGAVADTITIGADQTVAVVLTNTADTTPVTPSEPGQPEGPGTPVQSGDKPGGGLAITGGTATWGAVALGALLLIVGAGAFGLRRRTM